MTYPDIRWCWEPFDPDRTSLSGDISKLFRNEPVKVPGVLAVNAPPSEASVLAREVIQNSWDSALEVQKDRGRDASVGKPDGDVDAGYAGFELDFEFRSLLGDGKTRLISALALKDLVERKDACEVPNGDTSGDFDAREILGLPPHSCLDKLDDQSVPLELLFISETGTTGMYGPWGKDSRMYLALASVGYTPKKEGGGSFGYGKAGMIRGSGTRTVIAYSCFRSHDDDPGVTRRLFGMTYWGEHEVDEDHYVGFARFGSVQHDGSVRPFENEEADAVADSMGIAKRDPGDPIEYGTTFLVVDPTVRPADLCRAVERNWWPALEDPELDFSVTIRPADGRILIPRPKQDVVLRSFIRAYEVATVPQDNPRSEERRFDMRAPGKGRLGLVADLEGWSYPEASGAVGVLGADRSLVALMRTPRMVVEYYEVGRAATRPLVRGVFLADDDIDEALRDTEPKGHDRWLTEPSETASEKAVSVARSVLQKIKSNVAAFRSTLRPPPRPREKIVLPVFDRMMRQLLRGDGRSAPPPQGPRPFSISVTPMAEVVDDDKVRVSGQAAYGLSNDHSDEECQVRIQLRYVLDEDGAAGTDVKLEIEPPPGFERGSRDGVYVGELRKGDSAVFDFVSDSYSALWTGRFTAIADLHEEPTKLELST